jgi:hypothetical protein
MVAELFVVFMVFGLQHVMVQYVDKVLSFDCCMFLREKRISLLNVAPWFLGAKKRKGEALANENFGYSRDSS